MNRVTRVGLASCSFILLANFSSQDSTSGGTKPNVNVYGSVTDTSEKSFEAENITLERMYKQIPVYQLVPKNATEKYDPTANITRLDLSEIHQITFDPNQHPQKYNNREYVVMTVFSKDAQKTKNDYLVEADKKLICDEVNSAGPIEKEIKFKAVKEIIIDGIKANDELKKSPLEKTSKPNPYEDANQKPTKMQRVSLYVKNMFGFKRTA